MVAHFRCQVHCQEKINPCSLIAPRSSRVGRDSTLRLALSNIGGELGASLDGRHSAWGQDISNFTMQSWRTSIVVALSASEIETEIEGSGVQLRMQMDVSFSDHMMLPSLVLT